MMIKAVLSILIALSVTGCYYEYECDPYDHNYSHTEYECWTEYYEVEYCNRYHCWVEDREEHVCEDIHICHHHHH